MKKRILLKKDWSYDDEAYSAGTTMDVDETTANELVAEGYAKAVDDGRIVTKVSDDEGTKTIGSEDGSGSSATVTVEQFETLTKALVSETAKAISAATVNGRPKLHAEVVGEAWEKDTNKGYAHSGLWLKDLMIAETTKKVPKHLQEVQDHMMEMRVKALGSDEYASVEDSIGGFFVRPEFDDRFLRKGFETEWIRANGAMIIPTSANMIKINAEVDKDRQTNLYGGVDVFWQGERETLASARGKFEQVELKPDYLTGLYFVTDHLLKSAPALGAIIGRQFSDAFQRKETLAFLSGNGVGEPLGVFNSPARRDVARETSSLISYKDVREMRSRCWDYENAIWVAGFGTYSELATMRFTHIIENQAANDNVGGSGQLVWHDNISGDVPNRLLGRPLIFTEHAGALGAKGDLSLIAWNHYLIAESPEFVNDSSIHVRFDSLETAFRFAKRIDGQPWWRSTLTVQNSFVMSPFCILDA